MNNLVRVEVCAFLLVVCASASGCKVFDESLLEEDEDPVPTDPQALAVADVLSCDAPLNESRNSYRRVDTSQLSDDIATLPRCLRDLNAPGNDAFFAVDMEAGSKWHFHVQVSSAAIDPAIYVLDSCSDSRSCQDTYFGINACAAGENEHFSFIAPTSGRYFVGIDGLTSGGEPIEVFAVHANCGNGEKEHSEYCDDQNDDPSDGCHQCRPVLLTDRAEVEPNDGPLDPNLVHLPEGMGERRFSGALGSRCDFDFFEIEVPPGARTRVSLGEGVDCARVSLQLRKPTEPNPFEVEEAAPGAPCTEIDEELDPGKYLIRVAARREPGLGLPALDYELRLAIEPVDAD